MNDKEVPIKTAQLIAKSMIVLDVDYDTKMIYEDAAGNEFEGIHFIPEGVWCREEDRSDSDHIAVCLPFSIFEQFGSPAKLTVILEPGDKLNTLALAEESHE